MPISTQTKRYKSITEESGRERQLSGLFTVISNNLLVATEILSTDYKIKAVSELELLSKRARVFSKELASNSYELNQEEMDDKISYLKNRMLSLVEDLTSELTKLDANKNSDKRAIENIIVVKRLLRDSQRGLITIQD